MTPCTARRRVDRHFDSGLAPGEERLLRDHLPTCADCSARYERHLALESIDPVALGPRRRLARGLGLASERSVVRWMPLAGALAAAAAVLLLLGRSTPSSSSVGFTARGAPGPARGEVFVYRAVDHGQPMRAGATLGGHDELAFAYENPSAKPYLMIYGVDEQHRIVWYYPAWTDAADDPTSIRAEPGRHALPEAVAQELTGRALEIHAVFSDNPLSVKQVERVRGEPTALPGATDDTVSFTVER